MIHRASPRFWDCYRGLPEGIRQLADKSFEQLAANPRHPSLQLKKVGRFWSARVGLHHRALAVEESQTLVWFWIGTHHDYDRLIR